MQRVTSKVGLVELSGRSCRRIAVRSRERERGTAIFKPVALWTIILSYMTIGSTCRKSAQELAAADGRVGFTDLKSHP